MGREQLTALAWTGILLSGMLAIALRGRPASRGSRALRRAFWSLMLLWGGGMLGGVPPSALAWALTACLGLPGYAAAAALALP